MVFLICFLDVTGLQFYSTGWILKVCFHARSHGLTGKQMTCKGMATFTLNVFVSVREGRATDIQRIVHVRNFP